MGDEFRLWLKFTSEPVFHKSAGGDTVIVEGYCTTEALDSDGQKMSLKAVEEAWPEYWKYANIREMHDAKKAAGVGIDFRKDDKGMWLRAEIVASEAVKLVRKGVYKGFSLGGKILTLIGNEITKIIINEVSTVDRPSCPEAQFSLAKFAKVSSAPQPTEVTMPDPVVPAPAPAAEVAPTPAAAKPRDLAKSLSLVTWLVSVLQHLADGDMAMAFEIAQEGHLGPQKAKIDSARKLIGEAMSEIAAQEVAEMDAVPGAVEGAEPAAGEAQPVEEAAKLAKAAASEEHVKAIGAVRKALNKLAEAAGVGPEDCGKCAKLHKALSVHHAALGKTIAAHKEAMGEGTYAAMCKTHEAMGKALAGEDEAKPAKDGEKPPKDEPAKDAPAKDEPKDENAEKLAKMAKDFPALEKRATDAEAELAKAAKRIAELEAQPAAPKGAVRELPAGIVVVAKEQDGATKDLAKRAQHIEDLKTAAKGGNVKDVIALGQAMLNDGLIDGGTL